MIYLTIAIFRWFSRQPSPLNGMVGGNLCVRWVSDGFGVPQLSCTDGFRWSSTIGQTMRCNGPSLQSSQVLETTWGNKLPFLLPVFTNSHVQAISYYFL